MSKDRFNKETNSWENDVEKFYDSMTAFGRLADNIIASLKPGDHVIGTGERRAKPEWTDKNGQVHSNDTQIVLRALGPDLNMYSWTNNKPATSHRTDSKPKSKPVDTPTRQTNAQASNVDPFAVTPSANDDDPLADFDPNGFNENPWSN